MRPSILLLTLVATSALASTEYPNEIARVVSACRAPVCTVCHQTSRGGTGTATRAFAITMQNAGLTGNRNLTALRAALATVEADGTDSDADGVLDIPELKQGSDPSNAASKTQDCTATTTGGGGRPGAGGGGATFDPGALAPPEYGCSAAPSAAGGATWVLLALAAARLSRRRRT